MERFRAPAFGEPVPFAHPSSEAVRMLRLRRSTSADLLGEPGPDPETLRTILEIASRAPDHRKVYPFRFILFEGEAREKAGAILGEIFELNEPGSGDSRIAAETKRFARAPVVVAVVSAVDQMHRTPEWEQVLTAGAVCQNMLLAASAHGFAAQWITEWCAYDRRVLDRFGVKPDERIAGYVYIGTAKEDPKERQRPDLDSLISRFDG